MTEWQNILHPYLIIFVFYLFLCPSLKFCFLFACSKRKSFRIDFSIWILWKKNRHQMARFLLEGSTRESWALEKWRRVPRGINEATVTFRVNLSVQSKANYYPAYKLQLIAIRIMVQEMKSILGEFQYRWLTTGKLSI